MMRPGDTSFRPASGPTGQTRNLIAPRKDSQGNPLTRFEALDLWATEVAERSLPEAEPVHSTQCFDKEVANEKLRGSGGRPRGRNPEDYR